MINELKNARIHCKQVRLLGNSVVVHYTQRSITVNIYNKTNVCFIDHVT